MGVIAGLRAERLSRPFTWESCIVARPAGRGQKRHRHAPPAYASAVIGYTTSRDAIASHVFGITERLLRANLGAGAARWVAVLACEDRGHLSQTLVNGGRITFADQVRGDGLASTA